MEAPRIASLVPNNLPVTSSFRAHSGTGGRKVEGPQVLAQERRHQEHSLLRRSQPQPRHLHLGRQLPAELGLARRSAGESFPDYRRSYPPSASSGIDTGLGTVVGRSDTHKQECPDLLNVQRYCSLPETVLSDICSPLCLHSSKVRHLRLTYNYAHLSSTYWFQHGYIHSCQLLFVLLPIPYLRASLLLHPHRHRGAYLSVFSKYLACVPPSVTPYCLFNAELLLHSEPIEPKAQIASKRPWVWATSSKTVSLWAWAASVLKACFL